MKSDTAIILGVVVTGAAVAGLVWWGHHRELSPAVTPRGADPGPSNVGPFPDLRVGSPLLVDSAAANLPPPFVGVVPAIVDQILSDPFVVSVRAVAPSGTPFAGTIPRSSIVRVLTAIPPGLLQT